MNMKIIKAAAAMTLLLLGGCSWFSGPEKIACDPTLPRGYTLSHEPPPPGFAPPTLMPPPCTPDTTKKVADGKPPSGAPPAADTAGRTTATVAGR
jgi:hypothetical protein